MSMSMSFKNIGFNLRNICILCGVVFSLFAMSAQLSLSASVFPVLTLTINGASGSAVIVNGEEVTIGWHVDGPIENCTIGEKVDGEVVIIKTINTEILPSTGTMLRIPPEDISASYILSCDSVVEEVVLNMDEPTVSVSIDQGDNLTVNALTGRLDSVVLRWSSSNTNRCSNIWREKSSAPGVIFVETNGSDYAGKNGTGGWIRYDGNPRYIDETNIFYITCYNDDIGAEVTAQITLNVTDPPPPEMPEVSIWSDDYPTVVVSELWGYAWVDVGFSSQHAVSCSQKAYYADGTQYSNPPGWGTQSWRTNHNFTNIKISTTTDFKVTCSRTEVTVAGIVYPAVSDSKIIRIVVLPPGGVVSIQDWDRSDLPPVTTTISASPNSANKDNLTGVAGVVLTVNRENSNYCNLRAYKINGTEGDLSDDTQYFLSGWNATILGNGEYTKSVKISTSTRFSAYCEREYDILFGDPDEVANGSASAHTVVVTIDPLVSAPDPLVSLYANAVKITSSQMWNTKTFVEGFNRLAGNPQFLDNDSVAASSNKIVFPFNFPLGDDNFDVYLQVCDENDGESEFKVYSENQGLIGTYLTDSQTSPGQFCGSSHGTVINKKIGDEVSLADGELITVECNTSADGEKCGIVKLFFGVDGLTNTAQVNPVVTSVSVPMFWISKNTTSCYDFRATRADGSVYTWHGGSGTIGLLSPNNINKSTVFSVKCKRGGDNVVSDSSVNVFVPFSSTLSAETIVASGQCINDGSLPGAFGQPVDSPPGYGPDVNGFCIPLVDLAAGDPYFSILASGVDHVDGSYNGINFFTIVKNFGPGQLDVNSGVSYKMVLNLDSDWSLPDINSSVGSFDMALAAPVPVGTDTESAGLDMVINGIMFGSHEICSRVNLDGSPNLVESNTNLSNNTKCKQIYLAVPQPPMNISVDRKIIRKDQSVRLDWNVDVAYELDCYVRGPGGVNESFVTNDGGPNYIDHIITGPIKNKSEFILRCTENNITAGISSSVFTKKITVEVVPDYEEI